MVRTAPLNPKSVEAIKGDPAPVHKAGEATTVNAKTNHRNMNHS